MKEQDIYKESWSSVTVIFLFLHQTIQFNLSTRREHDTKTVNSFG